MARILTGLGGVVPLAFAMVTILLFRHAGIHMDTARDWAYALTIARAEHFPLLGPNIGGWFHLGPIWYYVLALPLALGGGFAAVALWVATLFSSQFCFAYRLGMRLGAGGGALFCAALTLPNGAAIYLAGTTHTIMIVPCVLACALAYVRWRERASSVRAFVLGLAVSLAIHAHPTTGLLLLPALASIWTHGIGFRVKALLAFGCGFALLFLPLLAASSVSESNAAAVDWMQRFTRSPSVWLASLWSPVRMQFELLPNARALSVAHAVWWAIALVLALVGWFLARAQGATPAARFARSAMVLAFLSVALATLSRDFVTYYMIGLVSACIPGLIALGWSKLPFRTYAAIVGVAFVLYGAFTWAALRAIHAQGFQMNISRMVYLGRESPVPPWSLQPMWPASSIASLQTRLCTAPAQSLHGPAVVGVDLVADVLMHAACPATPRSTLGGSDAANSRIGVPCALRSSNDKTGTVCWHAAREIVRSEPMPPAQRLAHPQRVRVRTPLVSVPFSTTLAAGEVLVVTQHRMEWAATGAWKVNLSDGMETHAVAPWWRAYACRADAKAGCWVEGLVETNDARGVDVSVVRSE